MNESERNRKIENCAQGLVNYAEALEFAQLNGNKPVELLNIAAQMKNLIEQLEAVAGEQA